jgi:hypothetical protein
LVQRDSQAESVSETKNEYWLHAQLKNLRALQTNYGRLDLLDLDLFLDVAVHQDVKPKIPTPFLEDLNIIAEWIAEKDRGKKWDLSLEHLRKQRAKRYAGKEQEVLRDMQDLFDPEHFCSFIDVTTPFHYFDCIRGKEFYDKIPFPTFPKTMKVVARTDLSLDNPAAEGKLIYKKRDLQEEVSLVFSR